MIVVSAPVKPSDCGLMSAPVFSGRVWFRAVVTKHLFEAFHMQWISLISNVWPFLHFSSSNLRLIKYMSNNNKNPILSRQNISYLLLGGYKRIQLG